MAGPKIYGGGGQATGQPWLDYLSIAGNFLGGALGGGYQGQPGGGYGPTNWSRSQRNEYFHDFFKPQQQEQMQFQQQANPLALKGMEYSNMLSSLQAKGASERLGRGNQFWEMLMQEINKPAVSQQTIQNFVPQMMAGMRPQMNAEAARLASMYGGDSGVFQQALAGRQAELAQPEMYDLTKWATAMNAAKRNDVLSMLNNMRGWY